MLRFVGSRQEIDNDNERNNRDKAAEGNGGALEEQDHQGNERYYGDPYRHHIYRGKFSKRIQRGELDFCPLFKEVEFPRLQRLHLPETENVQAKTQFLTRSLRTVQACLRYSLTEFLTVLSVS